MICPSCRGSSPGVLDAAVASSGENWWAPPSISAARANALAWALERARLCDRHAIWIADLVGFAVAEERRRRAVLPGTVTMRYVTIGDPPYEDLTRDDVRRLGRTVLERVERFVGGSVLGAMVELDLRARRARVNLLLAEVAPPITTVLDSARLVHTSAHELAHAIRARRAE
jgi:hypothetical protein